MINKQNQKKTIEAMKNNEKLRKTMTHDKRRTRKNSSLSKHNKSHSKPMKTNKFIFAWSSACVGISKYNSQIFIFDTLLQDLKKHEN